MERLEVLQLIERAKAENWTELDLRSKELTEIPSEIFQLSNLQQLDLSNNQITKIPDEIAALSNLQQLSLGGNQITEIPDAIAALSNLQELGLWNNQIVKIPDAIAELKNLRELYLDINQIAKISNTITVLSQLQKLHLSHNQITEIPDAIAALSNLQELDLSYNQITEIPDAITQLVNLKKLVLENNPITNVSPEIIRKGWGEETKDDGDPHAIFTYLKANNKRPLNEIKVLLIGEGDVGKTSLLNRLLYNTFNSEECKTPGINIAQWHLPEKPDIRLNLWDFGGQKVMHATHQFFLTKRSLYVLVIDNRKNEQQNRVEYWLKLLQTYGGDSPVIIVGNCADEHYPQIKIRTLKKKYPQIVLPEKDNLFSQDSVIVTSCKTGEGIEALRQEITRQIDTIPHIRDPFPVSWFKIKTKLEEGLFNFEVHNV